MKGMYTKMDGVPYEIISEVFVTGISPNVAIMSLLDGAMSSVQIRDIGKITHSKGAMGVGHETKTNFD